MYPDPWPMTPNPGSSLPSENYFTEFGIFMHILILLQTHVSLNMHMLCMYPDYI